MKHKLKEYTKHQTKDMEKDLAENIEALNSMKDYKIRALKPRQKKKKQQKDQFEDIKQDNDEYMHCMEQHPKTFEKCVKIQYIVISLLKFRSNNYRIREIEHIN